MSGFARVLVVGGERQVLAEQLARAWATGETVAVVAPQERELLQAALPARRPKGLAPDLGPAVVLGSGGSSGARRWCLQPLAGLGASAQATGAWLQSLGLDPRRCVLWNPLPLHHISGLMPLVRARCWGAPLELLPAELMRSPQELLVQAHPGEGGQALLSLVPTQLQRLLEQPEGVAWLQAFALIWVGGGPMAPGLAERCRQLGLRLSPCYGSTETGSMVTALPPEQFLAGASGCGHPLPHARLRLKPGSGALQIAAPSLAMGFFVQGHLEPLPLDEGWWSSGDGARLGSAGLQLLGRLDGAINSGGDTVFPEQVEQRLLLLIRRAQRPVAEVMVLGEPDPLWGEQLVALVRLAPSSADNQLLNSPAPPPELASPPTQPPTQLLSPELVAALDQLARDLPPSQRPRRWLVCQGLQRNTLGKWERERWRGWLMEGAAPGETF